MLQHQKSRHVSDSCSWWFKGVFFPVILFERTTLPVLPVTKREGEKKNDTKIDWDREEEEEGSGDKNLPAEGWLAINHKFLPVYTEGQSAPPFWSLCLQLPGSALNGCLSWLVPVNVKIKCLCIYCSLPISGLLNLIGLYLEFLCDKRLKLLQS